MFNFSFIGINVCFILLKTLSSHHLFGNYTNVCCKLVDSGAASAAKMDVKNEFGTTILKAMECVESPQQEIIIV